MGNYASTLTHWSTRSRGTPTSKGPSTTWAATSCRFVEEKRRRLRLQGQRRAWVDRPGPWLLARRWDDGVLLRGPHGPGVSAADLQPLQLRVADVHVLRPAPAGKAGPRQGGRTRPGVRRGALARCRGDRRQRQPVGALALGARGDRGRGHRVGAARRRAGGPGCGRPSCDRGQGSGHPRRWDARCRPRGRSRARTPGARRDHCDGQGRPPE